MYLVLENMSGPHILKSKIKVLSDKDQCDGQAGEGICCKILMTQV